MTQNLENRELIFHWIDEERELVLPIQSILWEEEQQQQLPSSASTSSASMTNSPSSSSSSSSSSSINSSTPVFRISVSKLLECFSEEWKDDFSIDFLTLFYDGQFHPLTASSDYYYQPIEYFDLQEKVYVIYLVYLSPPVYLELLAGKGGGGVAAATAAAAAAVDAAITGGERKAGEADGNGEYSFKLQFDEISEKAATEWMNKLDPDDFSKHQKTIQLISLLKATIPSPSSLNDATIAAAGGGGAGAAENNNNNNNNRHAAFDPIRNLFQFLQWRLVIRMGVLYFIFCLNRGLKDEKKYVIAVLMIFAYLLQTGILALLVERIQGLMGNNQPNNNQNQNNNNPAAGAIGGGGGGGARPAFAENNRNRGFPQVVENVRLAFLNGVNIPRTVGFLYDIMAIFIGFFASLFPAWQVQAEPLPAEPVNNEAVPPAADQPPPERDQNNQQNQ